jgi:hypothetical protein
MSSQLASAGPNRTCTTRPSGRSRRSGHDDRHIAQPLFQGDHGRAIGAPALGPPMRSSKVPEKAYKQRPAYHVLEDPIGHFSRELEPILFLEHWRSSKLPPG